MLSSLAQADDALRCTRKQVVQHQRISIATTYHLKCPDSANPDFQCAGYTLDVLKLNAFPPASSGRFAPEQEQLLCHADSVVVRS